MNNTVQFGQENPFNINFEYNKYQVTIDFIAYFYFPITEVTILCNDILMIDVIMYFRPTDWLEVKVIGDTSIIIKNLFRNTLM